MNKTTKIRLLIVDDHRVVRAGLKMLISTEQGIDIVGEATDGLEAVDLARQLEPDVVLLDLVMPRQDGITTISELLKINPEIKILVITSFAEDDKVFPAIKAGALGYLLKDFEPDALLQAIRDVYHGTPALQPSIALKLMDELKNPSDLPATEAPLTAREMDVLKLVARGLSNKQIAEKLSITIRTVHAHIRSILSKLQLANRTQAALYALREGIVEVK
ncbi:MAG: response regulator transcription factor [Anaerolineales bacterium]|nr:response regulator transcription factor [Anaerolineales bacterium]